MNMNTVSTEPLIGAYQCPSAVFDGRRKSIRAWQDRVRDRSLTVLLVTELCLVFVAAPLTARGLPIARPIVETLALAVLALVVVLSQRRGAIVTIVLGLIATFARASYSGRSERQAQRASSAMAVTSSLSPH